MKYKQQLFELPEKLRTGRLGREVIPEKIHRQWQWVFWALRFFSLFDLTLTQEWTKSGNCPACPESKISERNPSLWPKNRKRAMRSLFSPFSSFFYSLPPRVFVWKYMMMQRLKFWWNPVFLASKTIGNVFELKKVREISVKRELNIFIRIIWKGLGIIMLWALTVNIIIHTRS